MHLNVDPGFDADLELANRALERGWITREGIESAILAHEKTPGSRLLNHLPLTPEQRVRLQAPESPIPPEIAEVAHEPARQLDHYILGDFLHSGGMGRVYKAWDLKLSRWVALKCLKAVGDERSEAYFEREARLAAGLSHANIAAIYESGRAAGERFIAMQFIPGRTLDPSSGRNPARLAALVRDAARAVAYANSKGVIHRDLKPTNLMVTPEGQIFVLDFGLARPATAGRHSATGKAMGTPAYMSPEQARGAPVDARSDVYGLGATLYECLGGRPPFLGATIYDVLRKVEESAPPRLRGFKSRIPADLETIVMKCLEKDPARRYANADALADDLERFLNHDPIQARPAGTIYRARRGLAKRKAIAIASVASVVLVGVLGWWVFVGRPKAAEMRVQAEHLRLREAAMKLWAEARGLAMAGVDPEGIRRRAKEARSGFERAINVREDASSIVMKARCLQLEGEDDEALRALERAHEVEPGNADARLEMAKVLLWKYQLARGTPNTWVSSHTKGKDPKLSFDEPAPETPEQRGWRERGERLLQNREISPAQRSLMAGLVAMGKRDYSAAVQELAAYCAAERWDVQTLMLEATCRYFARDFPGAVATLDQVLGRQPHVDGFDWRGDAHGSMGLFEKAVEDYTKAIELNPKFPAAYNSRGIARMGLGQVEEACLDFSKAIELAPSEVAAYLNRANANAARDLIEDTVADLTKAIDLASKSPRPYNDRGVARRRQSRYDDAIADHTRAIEVDPKYAVAYFDRGLSYEAKGLLDEALTDYSRAIEGNPLNVDAYVNRGAVRADKGLLNEAIADFTKVIELDPKRVAGHKNRAILKHHQRLFDEAIADWTSVIELDPKNPMGYADRGNSKGAKGLHEEAYADFERAIEVAPSDWPLLETIKARIANRKQAQLVREATQLLTAGKHREAIDGFKKVVEAYPKTKQALTSAYNIACCYALIGEKSTAIEWLGKAVDLGWSDADHIEKDTDLDSLRQDEDYKKLLARLKGE